MLLTTLKRSFNRFVGKNTPYSTKSADAFLKGREFLLDNRQQYEKAYQDFRWPQLGQEFNWGKDYLI